MNIENKRMQPIMADNGTIGHITLDKLAIPETVVVTLLGEQIIPESFDIFGHPNFTNEQQMLYLFKENEIRRLNNGKDISLYAEIRYKERKFYVSRNYFDTIKGIQKSVSNLSDLNQLLEDRAIYRIAYQKSYLNEFILFGCFYLDQFGQVWSVMKNEKDKLKYSSDVEELYFFRKINSNGFTFTSNGYVIPATNSICSCCGKKLSIEDIKNNPCIKIDGKYYHESCWKEYRRLEEIDKRYSCLGSR